VSIKLEHPIYHNITCRPVRLISWDLTALSAHSVYTVQFVPSKSIFQIKTDIGEMVKNATDFQTSTGGKVEKTESVATAQSDERKRQKNKHCCSARGRMLSLEFNCRLSELTHQHQKKPNGFCLRAGPYVKLGILRVYQQQC